MFGFVTNWQNHRKKRGVVFLLCLEIVPHQWELCLVPQPLRATEHNPDMNLSSAQIVAGEIEFSAAKVTGVNLPTPIPTETRLPVLDSQTEVPTKKSIIK